MARLTFPATANDLRVPVSIGLPGADIDLLTAGGHSVPLAIRAVGEIDTGTNISGVSGRLLSQLPVRRVITRSARGVHSSSQVQLFFVSLCIADPSDPSGSMLTESDLLVMQWGNPPDDVDVLVGLDVLIKYRFLLDGPSGTFSIDF